MKNHFPVPAAWVVSWAALEDSRDHRDRVLGSLRRELTTLIDPEKQYAVRSSASVEDDSDFSCAGLFLSFLNISGTEAVVDQILRVWDSLESPAFQMYRQDNLPEETKVNMAVIVQEMVSVVSSGVSFSKNPMTGLSETIIEVVNGKDQTDIECWICKWGNWIQKPQECRISETLAREIVRQTAETARRYRQAVDVEWAFDGTTLYFLQVRPITRLNIPVYSNRIAREMLPGIIKPLVWSVNTRLINQTWVDILTRLTGDKSFTPESLTGHYYYRAYFNMAVFGRVFEHMGLPEEALELLYGLEQDGPDKPHMRPGAGILFRLPRILAFALSFVGIGGRMQRLIKKKHMAYRKLSGLVEQNVKPEEWSSIITEVFDETRDVAYFNIMIPMLAMMQFRMLAGILKKNGHDPLALELRGAREAADRFNPQNSLQRLHDKYFGQDADRTLSPDLEKQLRQDIDQFMAEFGHFSDSGNDCSSIPWKETPELIRRMVEQSQKDRSRDGNLLRLRDLKLPLHKRPLIGILYRSTSRFAVHREEISSFYTYGYGQFRTCFVRLGEQLTEQGVLDDKEDIYYLYWAELADVINKKSTEDPKELVRLRRLEIESYRDAVLPETIFGTRQPPVITTAPVAMRGIPTSMGTYTGPVRVIRGLGDFDRLREGDVLVVPYSDVGLIPLFARARAVIAESGGILSHSSIVAREYHIPAVVSVAGACRMVDGTSVTVNGYTGDIVINDT